MHNLFNRLYAAETRLFRLNSALDKDGVRLIAAEQGLRAAQQRLAFGTVNGTVFGDRGGPPKVVGHVVGCNGLGYFGATVQLIDNSDHTTILGTRTTDTNGLADFGSPAAWPDVFDLAVVAPTGKRYAGVPAVGASAFPGVIELGFAPISPGDTVCTANGWWPGTLYLDGTVTLNRPGGIPQFIPVSGLALAWNAAYSVWVGEINGPGVAEYLANCSPILSGPYLDTRIYLAFSPTGGITISGPACSPGTTPNYRVDAGGNYPPATPYTQSGTPTTSDFTNIVFTYPSIGTSYLSLSSGRVDATP